MPQIQDVLKYQKGCIQIKPHLHMFIAKVLKIIFKEKNLKITREKNSLPLKRSQKMTKHFQYTERK